MKGICNAGPAELSFEWQADETSAFICRSTCPSEHVEQQSIYPYDRDFIAEGYSFSAESRLGLCGKRESNITNQIGNLAL